VISISKPAEMSGDTDHEDSDPPSQIKRSAPPGGLPYPAIASPVSTPATLLWTGPTLLWTGRSRR
jgi:hypothetical protein